MTTEGLYLDISVTPYMFFLSLSSAVPGSSMDLYVHTSDRSITADAADRQVPVGVVPQLHNRGHIHIEYSQADCPTGMSEKLTEQTKSVHISVGETFIYATYTIHSRYDKQPCM